MEKLIDITVIIPTYNRINTLLNTVRSICYGSALPNEIIIVDQSENAKEHAVILEEFAGQFYKGNLIIVLSNIPSSTKARNKGMSMASNDILVFMDDDVEVDNDTFTNVFHYMNGSKYSMVGGLDKLATSNGNIFPYLFGMRNWRLRKQGHVTMSMFGRYPTEVSDKVDTQWAMGYYFAIKKSLTDKWNLKFDEILGQYAYAEDLDFTYSYYKRSRNEGITCILTSEVMVSHLCSKEWRATDRRTSYVTIFNRYYLIEKHFGNTKARLFFWWANVGLLLKKIVKRDNAVYFFEGMLNCIRFNKDIMKGIMHTELYQ